MGLLQEQYYQKEFEGGIIPYLVVAVTATFWGLAFYGSFQAGYDAAQKN
ncbi:MAG: hypothetical protein HOO91_01985 [Bacteroidales bacterium]|nr:hypothetical protein [Bacteroidales bacterium]